MQSIHIEDGHNDSTVTDEQFLQAIQDPEKRREVISILMRAGLIPA